MRITKTGKRNLQDWNDADHAAAGHTFVAEPLPLARCNIRSSLANLEVAANVLDALGCGIAQAHVLRAIAALEEAMKVVEESGQENVFLGKRKEGL